MHHKPFHSRHKTQIHPEETQLIMNTNIADIKSNTPGGDMLLAAA
jgi:hypothetical protein